MSLDIPLSEDCLDEYEAMKMKSIYRFIVFVIKDETEVNFFKYLLLLSFKDLN